MSLIDVADDIIRTRSDFNCGRKYVALRAIRQAHSPGPISSPPTKTSHVVASAEFRARESGKGLGRTGKKWVCGHRKKGRTCRASYLVKLSFIDYRIQEVPSPSRPQVVVTFDLDANGILNDEATLKSLSSTTRDVNGRGRSWAWLTRGCETFNGSTTSRRRARGPSATDGAPIFVQ